MADKDQHGQPKQAYRLSANRERALNTLFGICKGIVADKRLNEREVAYLNTWLSEYEPLLAHDGDGIDIIEEIKSILSDRVVTKSELEDLQAMFESIAENRGNGRFYSDDVALHHLTGIVHGIVADAYINDSEIYALNSWIQKHLYLECQWPASIIFRRLRNVLSDGVITEEERADLYETLTSLVGGSLEEQGTVGGLSTRLFQEESLRINIDFQGRTFIFTGKFAYGTRASCEAAVIALGAAISSSITKSTDYLIVGTLSSRDWVNESFGRKIQKAMEMKESGHHISVIEEEIWCSYLPD